MSNRRRGIELVDGKLECGLCGELKHLDDYHNNRSGKFGKSSRCKSCANKVSRECFERNFGEQADPVRRSERRRNYRNRYYETFHGITLEDFERMLDEQNHECAICKKTLDVEGKLTHLDHNHATGQIRKLLCTNCNRGLGHFQDDPELMEAAAQYVRVNGGYSEFKKESISA